MKFLAAFLAAALTATVLSLGFAAPAEARCDNYGPCIDTRLSTWPKKNPSRAGKKVPFVVRLRSEDGKSPRATIRISVIRRGNGKVVWSGKRTYNDRSETYRTGKLPKGRFKVIVKAHTKNDRYQDARGRFGLRVKRR